MTPVPIEALIAQWRRSAEVTKVDALLTDDPLKKLRLETEAKVYKRCVKQLREAMDGDDDDRAHPDEAAD